ncbi:MAG: zinc-ribbon domain-containing protein [Desulfonatronovibrionaceae bacterium]
MEIKCTNCSKVFNVPDEKLPDAPKFTFKCPSCREKNVVDLQGGAEDNRPDLSGPAGAEPDYFPPGAKIALISVLDEDIEDRIRSYLDSKGYYLTVTHDPDTAAAKARLNRYNVVVVQDDERLEPLTTEVHSWVGYVRRETNVIMIGERAASFDQSKAFLLAVDFYLHIRDKEKIEEYLLLCINEHEVINQLWYRAAKEEEDAR